MAAREMAGIARRWSASAASTLPTASKICGNHRMHTVVAAEVSSSSAAATASALLCGSKSTNSKLAVRPVTESLFVAPSMAPVALGTVRPDTYTRAVAAFVSECTSLTAIPPVVLQRVKRTILDTLGVAVAGARHPDIVRLTNAVTNMSGPASSQCAQLWGTATACRPDAAAFVNGCAAHVLDFDDTWHPATHTASPVLPAILALAEMTGASGADVVRAFAVGIEVQGRLLRAAGNPNIPTLFHPVGTVGAMGAAAACANLLRLDTAHTQCALGIVASRCAGLMANVGSTTKSSHSGHAARMGFEAAILAAEGVTGKPDLLDHEEGFPAAFASFGTWNPDELLACGKPFHLEQQDVAFKTWPSHLGTHWAITAAKQLRGEMLLNPADHSIGQIDTIYLHGPVKPYIYRALPTTELDAKFSLQYTTVLGLLDEHIWLESFEPHRLMAPDVRRLLSKVRVFQDPLVPPSFGGMTITTSVKFKNGSWLQHEARGFRGLWNDPLSWTELSNKFLACVSPSLSPSTAANLLQSVSQLESAPSVLPLLRQLTLAPAS